MNRYIIRGDDKVFVNGELVLTNRQVVDAIQYANNAIKTLDEQTKAFDINIFELLGMRNLSGMVGEYLGKSIQRFSHGNLHSNLHQDGYPDLLLTNNQERLAYFETLYIIVNGKKYPRDKALFSPYRYGGIEIKATCGSTPTANKVPKPLIGEQRISLILELAILD